MATKRYIGNDGVKIVHAEPKSRCNGDLEIDGYEVTHDSIGVTSWSIWYDFESKYRPIDAMTFGLAVEVLRNGDTTKAVTRASWVTNGGFKSVTLVRGDATHLDRFDMAERVGDKFVNIIGWAPTASDILAEDWKVIR